MLIILELLFKLMPLESTQFRRRNRLATKREFQYLADVGLDQGVDLLLGGPLATKRFYRTVMGFFEMFKLSSSSAPPFDKANQFGALGRQTRRCGNIVGNRAVEITAVHSVFLR